jgi:hypothetical protein
VPSSKVSHLLNLCSGLSLLLPSGSLPSEPYLTFLNVHHLERQGADIQTKVEELEQLNQSMRDRDKMKDDAIAHLSDQLVAITGRLQELERRQITA